MQMMIRPGAVSVSDNAELTLAMTGNHNVNWHDEQRIGKMVDTVMFTYKTITAPAVQRAVITFDSAFSLNSEDPLEAISFARA